MFKTHHYTKAEKIVRDHKLKIHSTCHASLPEGVPYRDHYGNYVTARTVYISTPETKDLPEKNQAYGRQVASIHDNRSSDLVDALLDIAENIVWVNKFKTGENYERYMTHDYRECYRGVSLDRYRRMWRDHLNTAQRAKKTLPAGLIKELEALLDD